MNKPQKKRAKVIPLAAKKKPCPLCGKPGDDVHRPFCSRHCADLDLGKWFGGNYRIATDERPGEGGGVDDFEDDIDDI